MLLPRDLRIKNRLQSGCLLCIEWCALQLAQQCGKHIARAKEVGAQFHKAQCGFQRLCIARKNAFMRIGTPFGASIEIAAGKSQFVIARMKGFSSLLPLLAFVCAFLTLFKRFMDAGVQPVHFIGIAANQ